MRLVLSLAASTILFVSCGGGSSDPAALISDGYSALAGNDYAGAAKAFDQALTALGDDRSSDTYLRAKIGGISARCKTDPKKASADFLALAQSMPAEVQEKHFAEVAGRLGDASHFTEAVELLAAGKETFPDSAELDRLGEQLFELASRANDEGSVDALKGLGYAGD